MNKKILFWGAKYKAGIIYNLIQNNKTLNTDSSFTIKYLFDPNLSKAQFLSNAKFSNTKKDLVLFLKKANYFVTCIGNEQGKARYFISKELEKKKIKPLNIISKDAYVSDQKLLGKGVQIFPHAIAHHNAKVGDYSILNTGSILEHDCQIGNGVHIMPGAVIGGNTFIGDYVTIGLNATIMPLINIEEGAFIGAGAVVTKDVKKNEVVVGNPAKFLKLKTHKVDLKLFK